MTLGVTYFANEIEYTIETVGFLFPFLSFSYSQFQNSRARHFQIYSSLVLSLCFGLELLLHSLPVVGMLVS